MAINIHEIIDRNEWEQFVVNYPQKSFLESWGWGEFNRLMGDKIFRLGIFRDQVLKGVALIVKVTAKRGNFLFCPHGPLLDWQDESSFEKLINYLKILGKDEQVSFIRISPFIINNLVNRELFKKYGFRAAPIHMHSELSWMLDITPNEEILFKNFRKTHRNLIRKAEKEGITVVQNNTVEGIKKYFEIQKDAVKKHGFVPFSEKYLINEFIGFIKDNQIVVWQANYHQEVISAALIVYYGGVGFYHHGASLLKYKHLPASYLLQWRAIKEAKARGCKLYNFWGIVNSTDEKHPWWGLSLFKKGFNGFEEDYLHAQDLILNWKYYITWMIETIRKKKRGL